jgi:hypothetical protein
MYNDAINRLEYSASQEMVILNDELGKIESGYGLIHCINVQFAWMNRVKVWQTLGIFGIYTEIPNTNLPETIQNIANFEDLLQNSLYWN